MNVLSLTRRRWRVAALLSLAVVVLYFGFILLIAFGRQALGTELVPGLSLGILLGALVIVGAWLTTWIYARWAANHLDPKLEQLRSLHRATRAVVDDNGAQS